MKVRMEDKSRKHILCEKVPLVAMFLAAAFALVLLTIPGLLGLPKAAENLTSSVLAVLFMIAYTRWFAPEFKGAFKTSHLATGLAFVWLAFAFKFFGAYLVNLADSGFYIKPQQRAHCFFNQLFEACNILRGPINRDEYVAQARYARKRWDNEAGTHRIFYNV